MKPSSLLLTLSTLTASVLADAGPAYFTVISARSASPVHLLPLTARGGKFYLGGGAPSSYCPPQIGTGCPPGTSTTLAGGNVTLSLGVVVPGGQRIYVSPDGSLSYTQAHSAYIPTGSVLDGFTRRYPQDGESLGGLDFDLGFVACEVQVPGETGDEYQVFGLTQEGRFDACIGFDALTSATEQPGAWQY